MDLTGEKKAGRDWSVKHDMTEGERAFLKLLGVKDAVLTSCSPRNWYTSAMEKCFLHPEQHDPTDTEMLRRLLLLDEDGVDGWRGKIQEILREAGYGGNTERNSDE